MRNGALGMVLLATVILAGCGGGGGGVTSGMGANIATISNIPGNALTSWDLGVVDTAGGRYYFTDRNNKSVDEFDTNGNFIAQLKSGFTGCSPTADCVGASTGKSGPNGIDVINGGRLAVGDVPQVFLIDKVTGAVSAQIALPPPGLVAKSGFRADEGCFDPVHNIYAISSPNDNVPFMSFIDTTTNKLVSQVAFTDSGVARTPGASLNTPGAGTVPSAGLEACFYDAAQDAFFVNNDGSTENPDGEVNAIPGAAVRVAGNYQLFAIAGVKVYPEGNCDPTGIVAGSGNQMGIVCRPGTKGAPNLFLIMDRTAASCAVGVACNILASPLGGAADQVAFDAATNQYFSAASRWPVTGTGSIGGACSATTPCAPVINVISAASMTVTNRVPSGNNSHSIAVGAGHIFSPFQSPSATGGGTVGGPAGTGFPAPGGLAVFTTN